MQNQGTVWSDWIPRSKSFIKKLALASVLGIGQQFGQQLVNNLVNTSLLGIFKGQIFQSIRELLAYLTGNTTFGVGNT